jgi:hypothetical protein
MLVPGEGLGSPRDWAAAAPAPGSLRCRAQQCCWWLHRAAAAQAQSGCWPKMVAGGAVPVGPLALRHRTGAAVVVPSRHRTAPAASLASARRAALAAVEPSGCRAARSSCVPNHHFHGCCGLPWPPSLRHALGRPEGRLPPAPLAAAAGPASSCSRPEESPRGPPRQCLQHSTHTSRGGQRDGSGSGTVVEVCI